MTIAQPLAQTPQPLPQPPGALAAPTAAASAPLPLDAQAQAYAAKLAPTINMAHSGGIPGGMSMGGRPNPLLAKNPWRGMQGGAAGGGAALPGGTAPAIPSLAGYFGVTPSMLGRWTSPQNGAVMG
jgi:hypothetical protein